ncbi:MAG: signal peptidase II [Candidatus Ancillula sp.]|jgi:lipoprotein signal peptidase|nr:signal peptidase II [Candidatus Ancillula sp.]
MEIIKQQKITLFSSKTAIIIIFWCCVVVDLVSKLLVVKYNSKSVLFNSGVAFSALSRNEIVPKVMMFVSVIIGIILLVITIIKRTQTTTTFRIGMLLVSSGAFANGVDRFFNMIYNANGQASVTDFINYNNFVTGNIADIFVVLGSIMLAAAIILDVGEHETRS